MLYKKAPQYYADFNVIEVNRLKPRSYFIPFLTKDGCINSNIKDKRYDSDKVVCLNGIWDFSYFNNPNDLPDEFDTDKMKFDKLDVPSCWQFNGYGNPVYLNARYPFRFKPPVIPTKEPVTKYFSYETLFTHAKEGEYNHLGVYRTFFKSRGNDKRYIIIPATINIITATRIINFLIFFCFFFLFINTSLFITFLLYHLLFN